ncbi:MAG: hypothetical protein ABI699_18890 [Caldimonas sp.]
MSAVAPPAAAGVLGDSLAAAVRPAGEATEPSAAARIAASRVRLRGALLAIARPPVKPSLLDDIGVGNFLSPLLDRLKALPGAALVIDTLERWWAEHPLHTAGIVAGEASRQFVAPFARRNPYALIFGSVVVGALFMLSRPWRWIFRPALFVGLLPQLASQALKRMPVGTWVRMLATLTAKHPVDRAEPARPPSGLPRDS